jgi:hypothetical protein
MGMLRLISLVAAMLLATGAAQTAFGASEPAGLEKLWATYPLGEGTEADPTTTASDPKPSEPTRTPAPAPPAEGTFVQTERVSPSNAEQPAAQEPSSVEPSPRSRVWIWAVLGGVAFLAAALAARQIRPAAALALARRAPRAVKAERVEAQPADAQTKPPILPPWRGHAAAPETPPDATPEKAEPEDSPTCRPHEVSELPVTPCNLSRVVEGNLEQGGIERVRVVGDDSGQIEILADGSVSIPLLEEQVVKTKRAVVRERIIVRKRTVTSRNAAAKDQQ